MANLSDYTTGTVSVAANGTVVTGVGTSWATLPAFKEGDWFIANGWVNIVQSVDSNTQLTLAMPWRGGALSASPYRLRYMSDGSRTSAMTKALLELLGGSGSLEALAALSGLPDHIPIFAGPGVMYLIPRSELIDGVKFDAQVATLADRAAYNGQPAGFTVLVSDNGDGRSAIYSRVGAAGNWSAPAFLTGPQGEANLNGTSTTSVASTTGNKTFTIVEPARSWGPGQRLRASRTASPTQFVEGVVVSYTGNTLVLNVLLVSGTGSHANWSINPVGEPGTITGVTPFWNTRISTDTNAAEARTALDIYSKGETFSRAEAGILTEMRNKIINPLFSVNQRGVSGTVTLAAGKYGHDRFKAGSSGCTYTFSTASNGVTTITITAGTLMQTIEAIAFAGATGTYVLSWTGNAQGRINTGAYGATGRTASIPATANVNVEWSTGTLSLPQLELGFATPFTPRHIQTEYALCQRYFQIGSIMPGAYYNTTVATVAAILPVQMRSTPTVSILPNAKLLEPGVANRDILSVSGALSSGIGGQIDVTTAAIGNVKPACFVQANSLALDAEL